MSKKYIAIYNSLKEAIRNGTYQDGQKLPAEHTLMEKFQVSRQTIRLSLDMLRQDGLIRSNRGSGTYVHIAPPKLHTKRIAVIAFTITQSDFPFMLSGMEAVFSANGYTTMVYSTHDNVVTERQILTRLCEDPVDGILLTAVESHLCCANLHLIQRLQQMGTKIVFFGMRYNDPELADIPYVTMDDYDAIYQITRGLLSEGHTHLGGLFTTVASNHLSRLEAVRQAVLDADCLYQRKYCLLMNDLKGVSRVLPEEKTAMIRNCDLLICTAGMMGPIVLDLLRNDPEHTVRTVVIFDEVEYQPCKGVRVLVYKGADINYGQICAKKMLRLIDGHQETSTYYPWTLKQAPEIP